MRKPTPAEIKAARIDAGHTQLKAARTIYLNNYRTWQAWERGENKMPIASWELYLLKTRHLRTCINL